MPTSRPFAYNTGPTILGTSQFGNLAVGTPTSGVTGSPQWWNGPDEELGYVIAESVSGNTQPTPVSGVSASVGFFRSTALTESSFIQTAQAVSKTQTFATGNDAYLWLTGNSYWASWIYSAASSNLRLLIIGDTSASSVRQFVSSGLTSQGVTNYTISAVTASTTYAGTSTMANDYDAILYYTNSSQIGSTGLTSNLTTFVNAGGGLVSGVFLWNLRPLNFNYQLTAFSGAVNQSSATQTWTGDTTHPILSGVSSAITNSAYFTNVLVNNSAGSTTIARIVPSNTPFVGVNSTTYLGRIVSVNTHPPGMSSFTNMRVLFARALMWAAKRI